MEEQVNHPQHYGGADNQYEAIKIIEEWKLDFCLGNTIKYIARAGKKNDPKSLEPIHEKEIEDLKKAAWYLQRRIEQLSETTIGNTIEIPDYLKDKNRGNWCLCIKSIDFDGNPRYENIGDYIQLEDNLSKSDSDAYLWFKTEGELLAWAETKYKLRKK